MIVCVCLYDCMCMIVWQCARDVMMTNTTQGHIQLVTACHPTWLRLYQLMLVEIPGEDLEGSNADTCCGSGGFRCRYLVSFWRVPVQIPVEAPGPGSFTIVQHHCVLACFTKRCEKIKKQSRNFQTVGDSTWVYFFQMGFEQGWNGDFCIVFLGT